MKDNVMSKLNEFGIRGKASEIILSDIFGKDIGSTRVPGLIDCESPTDFDKNLDRLSNEWHLLHPLGERFVAYFRKYKA